MLLNTYKITNKNICNSYGYHIGKSQSWQNCSFITHQAKLCDNCVGEGGAVKLQVRATGVVVTVAVIAWLISHFERRVEASEDNGQMCK